MSAMLDYPVFPIVPGTKNPAIKEWRFVKPGQYPAAGNYAVALTPDLLVLDFDSHKEEGRQSVERFFARYPNLRTRIVQTPRGGAHVYLKKPPHLKYRQKKQPNWPGVDFQSDGQYVIGPGSQTVDGPDRGTGTYVLLGDAPIADAPADFLAELEHAQDKAITAGAESSLAMCDDFRLDCQISDPAIQGQGGDDATFKLACRGRDMGLPADIVYQYMRDEFNPRCQPPWAENDLYSKIQNAFRYAKNAAGNKAPEAIFTPPDPKEVESRSNQLSSNVIQANYEQPEQKTKKPTIAEQLVACASNLILWHDELDTAYATTFRNGHVEHYRIQSTAFRRLFEHVCYKRLGKVHSEQHIKDALRNLEVRALHDGEKHKAWLRVAEYDQKIYVDLCDADWRTVEISADGYRVVSDSPVRFIRTEDMRPLPAPELVSPEEARQELQKFREMIRFADSRSWALTLVFLMSCFKHRIDYPLCLILGEQGSGKSGFMEFVRGLVDPNARVRREPPKEPKQVMIAGVTNRVPSWENVSHLNDIMQDAFCRLSTGGSIGERKYYTNFDETTLSAMAPAIINGISLGALNSDLLDRSLVITLAKLPGASDVPREEREEQFESIRPFIFGALCGAVSCALRRYHSIKVDWLPRLSGAYKWALAASPVLGLTESEIEQACRANEAEALESSLEGSPFIQYVCNFMANIEGEAKFRQTLPEKHVSEWPKIEIDKATGIYSWCGNPDLLLQGAKASRQFDVAQLPKAARTVFDTLLRHKIALDRAGISVSRLDRVGSCRPIKLEKRVTPELRWEDVL